MKVIDPLNGHFELTVEISGVLNLPGVVLEGLAVVPGDVFALDVRPLSVYLGLEIYREFLADNWDAISEENRWRYLKEFLSRPLTALGPEEGIAIPAAAFPLVEGDRLALHVMRLSTHRLFVYRSGPQ